MVITTILTLTLTQTLLDNSLHNPRGRTGDLAHSHSSVINTQVLYIVGHLYKVVFILKLKKEYISGKDTSSSAYPIILEKNSSIELPG
jgi:hypothetical protein